MWLHQSKQNARLNVKPQQERISQKHTNPNLPACPESGHNPKATSITLSLPETTTNCPATTSHANSATLGTTLRPLLISDCPNTPGILRHPMLVWNHPTTTHKCLIKAYGITDLHNRGLYNTYCSKVCNNFIDWIPALYPLQDPKNQLRWDIIRETNTLNSPET